VALVIKRIEKPYDPQRLRVALVNDAGDIIILRAKSKAKAATLITNLRFMVDHFEISYRKGD